MLLGIESAKEGKSKERQEAGLGWMVLKGVGGSYFFRVACRTTDWLICDDI